MFNNSQDDKKVYTLKQINRNVIRYLLFEKTLNEEEEIALTNIFIKHLPDVDEGTTFTQFILADKTRLENVVFRQSVSKNDRLKMLEVFGKKHLVPNPKMIPKPIENWKTPHMMRHNWTSLVFEFTWAWQLAQEFGEEKCYCIKLKRTALAYDKYLQEFRYSYHNLTYPGYAKDYEIFLELFEDYKLSKYWGREEYYDNLRKEYNKRKKGF